MEQAMLPKKQIYIVRPFFHRLPRGPSLEAFPDHRTCFRIRRMLVYWYISIIPNFPYFSIYIAVINIPVRKTPKKFEFVRLKMRSSI